MSQNSSATASLNSAGFSDLAAEDLARLEPKDAKTLKLLFELAKQKIASRSNHKHYHSLPWYLLLGQPENNANLCHQNELTPLTLRSTAEEQDKALVRFWYNDEMVVVECGCRVFSDLDSHVAILHFIAQLAHKFRPTQPFNGVISLIDCETILTATTTKRSNFTANIRRAILALNQQLNLSLPVYPVVVNANKLADFDSYFSRFPASDRLAPLGVTFACQVDRRFVPAAFRARSQAVVDALNRLATPSPQENANAVWIFSYQLSLFFANCEPWLNEISVGLEPNVENKLNTVVWVRGIYLTTAGAFLAQSQERAYRYDLISQFVAQRFLHQRIPNYDANYQTINHALFSKRLFKQVLLPERTLIGDKPGRHRRYVLLRTTVQALFVSATLLLGYGIKQGYDYAQVREIAIGEQLAAYQQRLGGDDQRWAENTFKPNLLAQVNALEQLRTLIKQGQFAAPWFQYQSLTLTKLERQLQTEYHAQLQLLLLPQIAALITDELKVYSQLNAPSALFDVLRFYLMLFNSDELDFSGLNAFVIGHLPNQAHWSAEEITMLSRQLSDLFHSNYQHQLQPDAALLKQVSAQLTTLSSERFVYERIKQLPQYRAVFDVKAELSRDWHDGPLYFKPNFQGYLIPALYTRQGFAQLDLSPKSPLLRAGLQEEKRLRGDESDITGNELAALSDKLQAMYVADYIAHWQAVLDNVEVIEFSHINELSARFRAYANTTHYGAASSGKPQNQSDPISRLLQLVLTNTQLDVGQSKLALLIASPFNELNQYSKSGGVGEIARNISQFYGEIASVLGRDDNGRNVHKIAMRHAQGTQDSLYQLQQHIKIAPARIGRWLSILTEQLWAAVLDGAVPYINHQWQQTIYQRYKTQFAHRFPFDLQSAAEVDFNAFNAFFKPKGVLANFIDKQLAPFVTRDNWRFRLKKINGLSLPLTPAVLGKLEQAEKIRALFFSQSDALMTLTLALRPQTMNATLTGFELKQNQLLFSYRHGPHVWTDISWAMNQDSPPLSASFYRGQTRVETRPYAGRWALLRWLFAQPSKASSARLIRTLHYAIKQQQIVFDYKVQGAPIPLTRELFSQFHLEPKLMREKPRPQT